MGGKRDERIGNSETEGQGGDNRASRHDGWRLPTLAAKRIGAIVVVGAGDLGIVSERDVIRPLQRAGPMA
jgi:hypothetical protein